VVPYLGLIALGAVTTAILTALVLALGLSFGLAVALARMSRFRAVGILAHVYIEFFRTTPPLIQILWFYFVLPQLLGQRVDGFTAVVLALGLNTAAFAAEIYRTGLAAVPRGQREAAQVLGLSRLRTFMHVTWPQALRTSLPPLALLAVLTVKGTSLASVLGVLELTQRGNLVAQATLRPIEVYSIVAVFYFALAFPLAHASRRLERRFSISERDVVRATIRRTGEIPA
jgi:His/Glu/Gln/Arg/opine family amino acid ABC transporter permease subunit